MTKTLPLFPVACFAPPLTEELLAEYQTLVEEQTQESSELREGLDICLTCVRAWWALPESTRTDGHKFSFLQGGKDLVTSQVTPLEERHIKSLWDVTPWFRECKPLQELFDTISNETQKPLRDAAHHLLWHVIEIANDREPLTQDKLREN